MNVRKIFIDNYIKENNLENSKIITNDNKEYFEYYDIDNIDKRLGLPDTCIKDKDGKTKYGYLKDFSGEEMRLVIGYTGSGKSMRHLLPSLVSSIKSGHSAIVTDISGQLLDYSYRFLKKEGVEVKILNFLNPDISDTFNPLEYETKKVARCEHMLDSTYRMIHTMANTIIQLKSTKDPNWNNGAKNIIKGIILGMYEAFFNGEIEEKNINIYNIVQQSLWLIKRISKTNSITLLEDIAYYETKDLESESVQSFAANVECSPVTRSGYFSCVNDNITDINYSYFYKLTSFSSFSIDDFLNKQTVLFIITGGTKSGDSLIGMLINQLYDAINEITSKSFTKKLDRPIQLFLDEFANINFGDSDRIREIFTTTRKNQLFFNMYIQNYEQLRIKFGTDSYNTIISNSTHYFLGATDYQTREEFANSCGKKTIETPETYTKNSVSSLTTINLINPNDLNKLNKGYMYINGRQGFDTLLTYFEAAYNLNEFIPTKEYEHFYHNSNNYKETIAIQPLMFKPVNLANFDPKIIRSTLNYEMDEYFNFIDNPNNNNYVLINKYLKYGLIKKKSDKYVTTLSKEKIEKLKEIDDDRNHHRFRWEE